MGSPPTISGIEAEEVRGDVMRLLPPLERALRATEGCLRAGLTISENLRAFVRTARLTVPDDWVAVTLANGFQQFPGATQFGTPAVRFLEHGEVETRGLVERPAGAPAAGTTIFVPPVGYPTATIGDRRFIVDGGGAPSYLEIIPSGAGFVYNAGPVNLLHIGALRWVPQDRRPPAWSTTLDLEVPTEWRPARVVVLDYRYVVSGKPEQLRRTTGAGRVQWSEQTTREGKRTIRIERIFGMSPGTTYDLTLGFFPE